MQKLPFYDGSFVFPSAGVSKNAESQLRRKLALKPKGGEEEVPP
jgi:hypothetical protein